MNGINRPLRVPSLTRGLSELLEQFRHYYYYDDDDDDDDDYYYYYYYY